VAIIRTTYTCTSLQFFVWLREQCHEILTSDFFSRIIAIELLSIHYVNFDCFVVNSRRHLQLKGTHNTDVKWENDEKSRIRIRKSVARIHTIPWKSLPYYVPSTSSACKELTFQSIKHSGPLPRPPAIDSYLPAARKKQLRPKF
jgi:hypothetical protein